MMECSSLSESDVLLLIQKLSSKEKKTLLEKVVKLQEEVGELAEASLILQKKSGSQYKKKKQKHVQEEALDVVLVALDIFFQQKGTQKDLTALLRKKAQKWKKFQLK